MSEQVNFPGGTDGPVMTEYGLRCWGDAGRCKHFGLHDFHYPYCSAQPSENDGYPWPGAGRHIRLENPDSPSSKCPYSIERSKPALSNDQAGHDDAAQKEPTK